MQRLLTILAMVLLVASLTTAAQRVELGTTSDDVKVIVLESNDTRTIVKFEVGAFTKASVDLSGETYFNINLDSEGVLLIKGEPALPRVCRSIIIPDDARMEIKVLDSEYRDFNDYQIAPSKGNLSRSVDPSTIPYEFGPVYNADNWYPSQLASIRDPFIIRDIRGIVTEIYPFRYNPSNNILRVYTSITVEISNAGPGEVNVLRRDESLAKINPEFNFIYQQRFINYNQSLLLYTPVEEVGDMLVITHDAFREAIMPFADWKRQKGIKTTVVNVSDIGNNANSIAGFIQSFYDSSDLAFVLLVGDASQVAPPYASGGASDPSYAKLAGGDDYPDIFVGRFSAEEVAHVETQVTRSVEYEMTPQTSADWYHKATGIASDEGPGHNGEYDYQHIDNIRADLLDYNYTEVDQIYDPGASATQVAQALDEGRGFINYCGHGYIETWSTTGFNNGHVNALQNDNKLPFIISVACNNGEFDNYTCFAEAWTRATHDGEPTGAIATYMSSISQSWNPPMWAQDEATDLLVAESKITFGGICYNGSCRTIEVEGSDGVEIYDTWNIFGDPSIMMYTDTPSTMTVDHGEAIIFTATQFIVSAPATEGTLCALYHDRILYGSAYTDDSGTATIEIEQALPVGEMMSLTVTCYNRAPYFGSVTAISPDGPYVVFDECAVNDEAGNNDGLIDYGESILLDMQLMNVGPDTALDIVADLSSEDEYVTITDDIAVFGDIAGDFGYINVEDAFGFDVSNQAPDGRVISFSLTVTDDLNEWESSFSLPVHAPVIGFVDVVFVESNGNDNGIFEAGETIDITATLRNTGSSMAINVDGTISSDDDYITIDDNNSVFGDIGPDESGNNSDNTFVVTAEDDLPAGHSVLLDLAIEVDGGYTTELQFTIRAMESFEYNDGGWTGQGAWQWGQPTSGPGGAYDGLSLWGTILGGDYPNNANDGLMTTYYTITNSGAYISFWHWYDIESGYDGGNLKITTDGGVTWDILEPDGGYPESNIDALNGEAGYSGSSGGWQEAVFNLGAYEDETAKIEFHFGADYTIVAPGWFIDAVVINGGINWGSGSATISVEPSSFHSVLDLGDHETRILAISNVGTGLLEFSAAAIADDRLMSISPDGNSSEPINEDDYEKERINGLTYYSYIGPKTESNTPADDDMTTDFGGPDEYGYTWKDSNEDNGPHYDWIDITSTGTPVTGLGDDTNVGPFDIGFEFPFYGNVFSSFRFCTNGFLSFTSSVTAYDNGSIPTGDDPANLVAPFWDDLNFNDGGEAYYYTNGVDSLIVSYINVAHYSSGGPGPYTFQVILLADGNIVYQYADINDPIDSHTIGIQDENGTIGLQVINNQYYIVNSMAIIIKHPVFWLTVTPAGGMLFPDESMNLDVNFDATEVEVGTYTGNIYIYSNDIDNPSMAIPCTLDVIMTDIEDGVSSAIPSVFSLDQNFPNPFNPTTEMAFGLPNTGHVTLEVFDIMGRIVNTLVDEELSAGIHKVIWDGTNEGGQKVTSGMYFYKLIQGENVVTKKMMMLK
ncbi:MAG: T9SS type A sorting domain-containing protein [candidate division Zixibacteria bacterium]|nr:T9SS type A sorting domain-containing protein [candidate division Zixibacteria bacterium]